MKTLTEWLAENGNPYHETRFAGKPYECVAVCCAGISRDARAELWRLADRIVMACVSGQFVELQTRRATR